MELESASRAIHGILESYLAAQKNPFVPGKSVVQYAGNVYGPEEYRAAIDTLLKGWLGLGAAGHRMEERLSTLLGKRSGSLVNSGSSANLLAFAALSSPRSKRRLRPGDEVITPAACFPTTVNPILQHGLVPVFLDVEIGDYNLMEERLESCLSPRTRALAFAHTLGNPPDMEFVADFCLRNDLVLIEDCCDALGGSYGGKPLGSFGNFSTISMYPSHHITIGEGGFVGARTEEDASLLRTLRDWGRACYCVGKGALLKDGTCGNRFSKWLDGIDDIVDHKYVYSEIGYNLKPIELQAAMGLAQLDRLEGFTRRRRENFRAYFDRFRKHESVFHLPRWESRAEPSWFAFPLTVREDAPFRKSELVRFLEERKIQTRNLFAGNLLRHPAYREIPHRIVGDLKNSDALISRTFFIGVYPGITPEMVDYVCGSVDEFLAGRR